MTKILLPKGVEININNEIQTSPTGKQFRLSGLKRDGFNWVYIFRYTDGGFFYIETDNNYNFKRLWH